MFTDPVIAHKCLLSAWLAHFVRDVDEDRISLGTLSLARVAFQHVLFSSQCTLVVDEPAQAPGIVPQGSANSFDFEHLCRTRHISAEFYPVSICPDIMSRTK